MGEYVIKILSRPKGRGDNGPRKRFGRPDYFARRLRDSVAPYFISFGTNALAPGGSATHDFADTAYGDWYWLRPDDILMVFTYSLVEVSVSGGFSRLTSGRCSVFWKRWKAGDPTEVTVSMAATDNYSLTKVQYVVLRNATTKGSPFTVATASGSTSPAVFPSIKATVDDLVLYTQHTTGASGIFDFSRPNFDATWYFFLNSIPNTSTFGTGHITVGIPSKSGTLESLEAVSLADSWSTLAMSIKPAKPRKRVLAGPHTGTERGVQERPPFLLPGDIVVTYVVSASSVISLPPEAGLGWEPVTGTPVRSGDYWLHVYWKRWDDEFFFDYSSTGFLRLYSVGRGATASGNPFKQFNVSTGSGSSLLGSAIPTASGDLVFYAGVAKFAAGYANALGPVTASGVSEFEIDADSDSVYYFPYQYRAASGYATGTSAGPFSSTFNRSALASWAVTFTLKK